MSSRALVQLLVPCKRMRIVPTQQLAARLILSASIAFYRGLPGSAIDLLSPPQWVMTDNGAELQRMTDANSKLQDKAARRVYDSGLELADKGADRESLLWRGRNDRKVANTLKTHRERSRNGGGG